MRGTKRFVAERDYYQILGLDENATSRDVDDACTRLSRPRPIDAADIYEQQKEAERLMHIAKAAEVLGDPIERAAYDRRRFGIRLPESEKVEALFTQGIKAFKQKNVAAAARCLREAVHLFPHRALYRVHLAIAYTEMNWQGMAESELKMALRIDPNDGFAQETVARLLYKVPDKTEWVLGKSWHKQAAGFAVGLLVCAAGWGLFAGSGNTRAAAAEAAEQEMQRQEAFQQSDSNQTLSSQSQSTTTQSTASNSATTLPKLASDFQPAGIARDYTNQAITRKTYYPVQGLVMAACKDGGMLTYKPNELLGWKTGPNGTPVLITKNNELIPAPNNVPLLLPNGNPVNLSEPGFPGHLFPEYTAQSHSAKAASRAPAPEGA